MRRIATSTLQPRPTRSQHDRCCGWQIRFESGGNSGGESRSRERSQPIQQGATSKCSSWCAPLLSELCGLPSRLFAVFATVAAAHTCRRVITLAGVACGERWPKATGETRSLLASQVALDLRVRRPSVMSLPLGVARRPVSIKNPTGNNHRRHHMRRIATSTLQPQPTQSQHDRCCGWQIRFESGGNSGGESRSRERSQPIQQGATSQCSSWCAQLLSELCGFP